MCESCNEPDFYLRCGHHVHKTCLENNRLEIFCSTCKTRITLSQPEEFLEALRADHELCFTDLQHLKLALELMDSGHLSYENEGKSSEIMSVAESFGLRAK